MAEMLIRAINNASGPAAKITRQYKQGDPVVVRPDGWPWTPVEMFSGRFWVVRIPSMSDEEALQYVLPDIGRRRAWKLNQAALPAPVRAALATGPVTLTRGQFLAAAERK